MLEYTRDVEESVEPIVDAVSKEALYDLKGRSPKKTGDYAKGWRRAKKNRGTGQYARIIYNARKPGLAHLLEKGHALRGGGRAAAFPHIAPVAEEYGAKLADDLKIAIRRGGR